MFRFPHRFTILLSFLTQCYFFSFSIDVIRSICPVISYVFLDLSKHLVEKLKSRTRLPLPIISISNQPSQYPCNYDHWNKSLNAFSRETNGRLDLRDTNSVFVPIFTSSRPPGVRPQWQPRHEAYPTFVTPRNLDAGTPIKLCAGVWNVRKPTKLERKIWIPDQRAWWPEGNDQQGKCLKNLRVASEECEDSWSAEVEN